MTRLFTILVPGARVVRARVVVLILAGLLAAPPAHAQNVPAEFLRLYKELETKLDAFTDQLAVLRPVPGSRPRFVAQLSMANSNRGDALLNEYSYYGVLTELDRLQAMGVDAISVTVSFPLFAPGYRGNQGEWDDYARFYRWLADTVRGRGLGLIVENGIAMPVSSIRPYYDSLTLAEYVRGRAESAVAVSRVMRPDYLAIGGEPDMEAGITRLPVNHPVTSTVIANQIITAVRRRGPRGMQIGTGIGTWQADYVDFVRGYCQRTDADFINLHLFPVGFDFLDRTLEIADMVAASGKRVSMTQAWLYKASEKETRNNLAYATVSARDSFSFWTPLDARFAEMLVRLARVKGFGFVTPFWTRHFFAYLDHAEVAGMPHHQVAALIMAAAAQNMIDGVYTPTAERYSAAIEAAK